MVVFQSDSGGDVQAVGCEGDVHDVAPGCGVVFEEVFEAAEGALAVVVVVGDVEGGGACGEDVVWGADGWVLD